MLWAARPGAMQVQRHYLCAQTLIPVWAQPLQLWAHPASLLNYWNLFSSPIVRFGKSISCLCLQEWFGTWFQRAILWRVRLQHRHHRVDDPGCVTLPVRRSCTNKHTWLSCSFSLRSFVLSVNLQGRQSSGWDLLKEPNLHPSQPALDNLL